MADMADMAVDEIIRALARSQHGLVARRQLSMRGVDSGAVHRRVRRGMLEELSVAVLRLAGTPDTDPAAVMAGVLDAGPDAAASHATAAALWGLPGFRVRPVEVIGRRARVHAGRATLAVVHQPRMLLDPHVTELDHLPVTTPSRTVFDLAGDPRVHPGRLERLLDTCWSRNLVSHKSLTRMLDELAVRGRPGITLMRELLAARPPDHRPPASGTEARFQEIARSVGLRDFVRQVDLGDEDRWIGRVDFVDRGRALIIEVDPDLWHGSLTDRASDEKRRAGLRAAGWTVESVTEFEVFHDRAGLAARLASLRRATTPTPTPPPPPPPPPGRSGGQI